MKFSIDKVVGIVERKKSKIDITCTSRDAVMELLDLLRKDNKIKHTFLYESENIEVLIGWVPVPLQNKSIAEALQYYVAVQEVRSKKDKNGKLLGTRIAVIKKNDIDRSPLPSYIRVEREELYVTYSGQLRTCKLCEQTGHKQAECPNRKNEFPALPQARSVSNAPRAPDALTSPDKNMASEPAGKNEDKENAPKETEAKTTNIITTPKRKRRLV
uniref:uncharacterized protein LOC113474432 n=1 Tax=Ciona intestinalis TaxID=7719 RepID=UPI000EF4D27D|nr:uncharacterized protein LOC113474432 [Ciona intestinalis]|eukprot:XP_026691274.1 uncharacterized protein LOC113474432 [Ciona intestinalis]